MPIISDTCPTRRPDEKEGNEIIVLLTACIDPKQVVLVERSDPSIRLQDYVWALRLWLANPEVKSVLLCENSGYDLTPIERICSQTAHRKKSVELLSFYGQDFPPERGKGYGELEIIKHALANSKLIPRHGRILKATGRCYVENVGSILRRIADNKHADVACDLRDDLTRADSRLVWASVSFFQDYLVPLQHLIDDSAGVFLEHVLARAVHGAMADGLRWSMLPYAPRIKGVSGTSNVRYPDSIFTYMKHEFFRALKAEVLRR